MYLVYCNLIIPYIFCPRIQRFVSEQLVYQKKLVDIFGFVVSDLGLKSPILQVHPAKFTCFVVKCFLISDLFLEYLPHILQVMH